MNKPDYVLINSISRSGGTFLKSLFDSVPGVLAFPIEFPTIKGPIVDFLTQDRFEQLPTVQDWIDETGLSSQLNLFFRNPYQRSFGRERKRGEPAIFFDYPRFLESLRKIYSTFDTTRAAYEHTWRTFFSSISVGDRIYEHDTRANVFVNHYPTDATRDFAELSTKAQSVCNLYLLHIVREPLENIASLIFHWGFFPNSSYVTRLGLARWEMYLYSALRNKALYPEHCEVVVYNSRVERLKEQLGRSRITMLNNIAQMDLQPTVLGIPFTGQSYKEKMANDVGQPYNYAILFSQDDLSYLEENIRRIYDFVGIEALSDIADGYNPSPEFRNMIEVDSKTFDVLLGRFAETASFVYSYRINLRRNLIDYMRRAEFRKDLLRGVQFLLKSLVK